MLCHFHLYTNTNQYKGLYYELSAIETRSCHWDYFVWLWQLASTLFFCELVHYSIPIRTRTFSHHSNRDKTESIDRSRTVNRFDIDSVLVEFLFCVIFECQSKWFLWHELWPSNIHQSLILSSIEEKSARPVWPTGFRTVLKVAKECFAYISKIFTPLE